MGMGICYSLSRLDKLLPYQLGISNWGIANEDGMCHLLPTFKVSKRLVHYIRKFCKFIKLEIIRG